MRKVRIGPGPSKPGKTKKGMKKLIPFRVLVFFGLWRDLSLACNRDAAGDGQRWQGGGAVGNENAEIAWDMR